MQWAPNSFDLSLTLDGTVVILAVTRLAAIGIVQWRKARVVEIEMAFKTKMLELAIQAAEH